MFHANIFSSSSTSCSDVISDDHSKNTQCGVTKPNVVALDKEVAVPPSKSLITLYQYLIPCFQNTRNECLLASHHLKSY